MAESCENSGTAAGIGTNEDVMAMAIFLQSNDVASYNASRLPYLAPGSSLPEGPACA
jgi:hypothetical protein